jgi:hypothetical protein
MSRHEGPTHTSTPPKLPATLRLGAVHLTVPAQSLEHEERPI